MLDKGLLTFLQIFLDDSSVDVIVINTWSTYGFTASELRLYFEELLRVTKHGGRIWIDYGIYNNHGTTDLESSDIALFNQVAAEGNIALRPLMSHPELEVKTENESFETISAYAFEVIKPD